MQTPIEPSWQPTRRLARGNAAEQILEDLRSRILEGELTRGMKLPTEKQLAEGYGVSGPTVREAIRGLTTAQLVEVRHGSGAYVTADADQLIGVSLLSMMQLERVGIAEVLGVMGALNGYAAELAAKRATEDDLHAMREALRQINDGADSDAVANGLRLFVDTLAKASGNVLSNVQVGFARELTGGSYENWRKVTKRMAKDRQHLVDAIASRDTVAARDAARAHIEHSAKVISSLPDASEKMLSEPALARLLGSMLHRD
jgi:GntR family transcriptional repressor for pyruvate dehydrogenase complex